MDVFIEYLISKKKTTSDILKIIGLVIAAIILSFVLIILILSFGMGTPGGQNGAMASFGSMISSIGLLLVAGVWFGAYKLMQKFSIEWEYILTNNFFDVDKIMGKSSRKRVLSIDFKEVNLVANVDDAEHNHDFMGNKASNRIKVLDFTGGKNIGSTYFIDTTVEGERKFIIFQPTSRMIEEIKKFNPRNIYIYE